MKRLMLVFAGLALAAGPLFAAAKSPSRLTTASATVTIGGAPLTIVVGNDTSMQVFNSAVPGTGQFYPPGTAPGETANSGVWLSIPGGGGLYGPFLGTAYAPVSLSPVTGTGTTGDPFKVVVVVDAGPVQLTETLTYVNGTSGASIVLSIAGLPGASDGAALVFDAFIGADLFLADNDAGFPFATPGSAAGSHGANENCNQQLQYTIAFLGLTPANGYSANFYATIYDEIQAGALSNTIAPGCLDDGAALQWHETLGGAPVVINTGVSFTGQAVPVGAAVPALSVTGLVVLVGLLAVVGFVLAKKSSLGA